MKPSQFSGSDPWCRTQASLAAAFQRQHRSPEGDPLYPRNLLLFTHSLQTFPSTRVDTTIASRFAEFAAFEEAYDLVRNPKKFRDTFLPEWQAHWTLRRAKSHVLEHAPISRGLLRHAQIMCEKGIAAFVPEAFHISRWFPVEKSAEHFRLIQNLKALNSMRERPPKMDLEPIHTFIFDILSMNWIVQQDATSYFYQFAVHPEVALFVAALASASRGKAELVVLLVLSMGFGPAPSISQRFSTGACNLTRRRCEAEAVSDLCARAWIDNFFLGAKTYAEALTVCGIFYSIATLLNIKLKDTQDKEPQQSTIGLGLVFDLKRKCVTLEESFLAAIRSVDLHNSVSLRMVLVVLGAIFWALFTTSRYALCRFPALLAFLSSSMRELQQGRRIDDPIPLSGDVLADLDNITTLVSENAPLFLTDLEIPDTFLSLWADASSDAAGFVLQDGMRDVCWGSTPYPVALADMPIYIKELWIGVHSLAYTHQYLERRHVSCPLLYIGDNAAVIALIKKGHGRSRAVNELLAQWYAAAPGRAVQAIWSSTHVMRADPLTRGATEPRPISLWERGAQHQCTISHK